MKPIYKIMAILLVFTNTNYAVDAVVLMASKGGVPYSTINTRAEALQPKDKKSRRASVPWWSTGSIETRLDAGALGYDYLEVEQPSFPPKLNLSVSGEQEQISDEEESDVGSLNRSMVLSRTQSFSPSNWKDARTRMEEYQSVTDFDALDLFESFEEDESKPASALAPAATAAPRWIPGEKITVTFTRNNYKETVVWGGRFEHHKAVCMFVQANPPRCQTPLTPSNQVIRQSVVVPGSRKRESRLKEASINSLLPIDFDFHLRTGEEIVKVKPRSNSTIVVIPELET